MYIMKFPIFLRVIFFVKIFSLKNRRFVKNSLFDKNSICSNSYKQKNIHMLFRNIFYYNTDLLKDSPCKTYDGCFFLNRGIK